MAMSRKRPITLRQAIEPLSPYFDSSVSGVAVAGVEADLDASSASQYSKVRVYSTTILQAYCRAESSIYLYIYIVVGMHSLVLGRGPPSTE